MKYIFEYWYLTSIFIIKWQGIKTIGIDFVYPCKQNFSYKKYKETRFAHVNIYSRDVCNCGPLAHKITHNKLKTKHIHKIKFTFSIPSSGVVTHWHTYWCYEIAAFRIFLNLSKNYRNYCLRIICFLSNKHHKIGTLTPCSRLDRLNCSSMPIIRLLTQDKHSEEDTWCDPVHVIQTPFSSTSQITSPLSHWQIYHTVLSTPYLLVRMRRPASVCAIFRALFSVFSLLEYNMERGRCRSKGNTILCTSDLIHLSVKAVRWSKINYNWV